MPLPQLIKTDSFYYLKESPSSLSNGKAVLFLHGLGENRSGINYLFSELASGLTSKGYAVYRFDLGGCGDSLLPLSLSVWKDQLQTLLQSVSIVVARGLSSLLLPIAGKKSILLRPFSKQCFIQNYPLIPASVRNGIWIPDADRPMSKEEEHFWFNLGVEAGCVGGFFIPTNLIWEIENSPLLPCEFVIDPPQCHPLFLFQKDRQLLLEKLLELL